ncbi:unnamed protein product [Trichobilharzia szidati]|nr:unnamed protein product [Trichobilharzia szidati]
MENVTWWNEKLWKSFIDHPNPVITKTNDTKPVVTDIRYTSQHSSLNRNEQWNNNSQMPPVNAHVTPSQLNTIHNKNVLQNTINFQPKSIEFQEASGMKPCNPQFYCNNLFHQICSRPVMNNLQSIYGNRNRPLGSLRVYYLTRPHSAATIGRSTSLQRTTSHEPPSSASASIDRTLSYMNMVPPLSARRSSSTCLNLSRECSISSLVQSTNTSTVKQPNFIDCSGKICPLHERSTTPLVYEGVNRKSSISNNNNNNNYSLSTRRRSAPKARTTTLSETSQQTLPKPLRRASSACVDDKSYRYTNKFINNFKVSSGQQEYNRVYKTSGGNLEHTATLSTGNEFIPPNSTRKLSYPSPAHQHAPSVQENERERKKAAITKSNQSSSLSVIPLSFQNVKYFKYPTSQRRSIKPTPVVASNKHQQNKIPSVQLDTDRTPPLYQYDKKVVKQTVETNPPDKEVHSTSYKSVKNATVIQPKTETILKVDDRSITQLNSPKKSCLSETTEKYTRLKGDTSEITVTTDKIDYDVSDHDNNNNNNKEGAEEEDEQTTKHSVESETQPLLSEEQIQVTIKDADYQSYPTPLHTDISNSSQRDEWRISEESVTPCKDAESKGDTSTETTQLQSFSDKDEFLCLDSSHHHLMEVSVTQSDEEETLNELNTSMNEKTDQISETKLCENNKI